MPAKVGIHAFLTMNEPMTTSVGRKSAAPSTIFARNPTACIHIDMVYYKVTVSNTKTFQVKIVNEAALSRPTPD